MPGNLEVGGELGERLEHEGAPCQLRVRHRQARLVFGSETIDEPGLTVPHPELARRAFVLEPLAELAPDLEVPGQGTASTLYAKLQSSA